MTSNSGSCGICRQRTKENPREQHKLLATCFLLFTCALAMILASLTLTDLGRYSTTQSEFVKHTILSSFIRTKGLHDFCNRHQGQAQAQYFAWKLIDDGRWSACAEKAWLLRYYELAPSGPANFFDIGCNKGYESGLFLDLLSPQSKISPMEVYLLYSKTGPRKLGLMGELCGACENCQEKMSGAVNASLSSKFTEVNVYCFEPSEVNFRALTKVKETYQPKFENHTQWHLVKLAVSNMSGTVNFPRKCGTTLCSLHNHSVAMETINAITVDDYVALHGTKYIDLLKIDTEGNDPAVLEGAQQTLQRGAVGLLYFEYHNLGLWSHNTLRSVVQRLAGYNYICYFDGKPTLARLTGCWHHTYEFKKWSNVVCVYQSHFMYKELEEISMLKIIAKG